MFYRVLRYVLTLPVAIAVNYYFVYVHWFIFRISVSRYLDQDTLLFNIFKHWGAGVTSGILCIYIGYLIVPAHKFQTVIILGIFFLLWGIVGVYLSGLLEEQITTTLGIIGEVIGVIGASVAYGQIECTVIV